MQGTSWHPACSQYLHMNHWQPSWFPSPLCRLGGLGDLFLGPSTLIELALPGCTGQVGARDDWERIIRTKGSTALILACGAQQISLQRVGNPSARLQSCHLLAAIKHGATKLFKNQTPASSSMCGPRGGREQPLRVVNTQSDHNEKALQGAAGPVSMPSHLLSRFPLPDCSALVLRSPHVMAPCPRAPVTAPTLVPFLRET